MSRLGKAGFDPRICRSHDGCHTTWPLTQYLLNYAHRSRWSIGHLRTTPRQRTLFWAALVNPDQLVPCCFSSASVSRLQLLRDRLLSLVPCEFQVRAWRVVLDAGFQRVCPVQPHFLRSICLATGSCPARSFLRQQCVIKTHVWSTTESKMPSLNIRVVCAHEHTYFGYLCIALYLSTFFYVFACDLCMYASVFSRPCVYVSACQSASLFLREYIHTHSHTVVNTT